MVLLSPQNWDKLRRFYTDEFADDFSSENFQLIE